MFMIILRLYCKAPTTTTTSTTATVNTAAKQKTETSDIEISTDARIKITPIALPTTSGQMMVDSTFPAAVVIGTLSIKSLFPVMSV